MMKAKINGVVHEIEDYLSENIGTRSNPEMYLHSVTTTEGKKFLAEKNEIEFPIAFAIIN
jgi:hypothetical protein